MAGLRSEKQALELSLYEAQQMSTQLESVRQQLVTENRDLLVKKDNLRGQSVLDCRCDSCQGAGVSPLVFHPILSVVTSKSTPGGSLSTNPPSSPVGYVAIHNLITLAV